MKYTHNKNNRWKDEAKKLGFDEMLINYIEKVVEDEQEKAITAFENCLKKVIPQRDVDDLLLKINKFVNVKSDFFKGLLTIPLYEMQKYFPEGNERVINAGGNINNTYKNKKGLDEISKEIESLAKEKENPKRKKWEYDYISIEETFVSDAVDDVELLPKMGKEGWELVSCAYEDGVFTLFLKREIL